MLTRVVRPALAGTLFFSLVALAGAPAAKPSRSEPDVARPLKWLVEAQNENGGYGAEKKSKPDVATTALAGLALMRLGHGPTTGAHHESTSKAVEFVVRAVEKTSVAEVAINEAGTQPQAKLGRYIDTFLAAQFLAEAVKVMPKGEARDRAANALESCVTRIQAAQRQDGSFSQDGWAPILSSAFASGGLYRAQLAGVKVKQEVMEKGDGYLLGQYDKSKKDFKTADSAGVGLYSVTGTIGAAGRRGQLSGEAAQAAMTRLSDESFMRGFGSYGGEEHVSYMLTSEAYATIGGKAWEQWNRGIRTRLANIQREDGTWRGDHCITSTTFCTAASLLTLTIQPAAKVEVTPKG